MNNPCIECGGNCCWHEDCEFNRVVPLSVIEDIRAEIKDGAINVEYLLEGYNDDDIDGIVEDVIEQVKGQVIKIIDNHIAEREQNE